MGNSYTRRYNNNNNKLPNIKGEIIIDDDNDILFHTYKDVLHIKYTNKALKLYLLIFPKIRNLSTTFFYQ